MQVICRARFAWVFVLISSSLALIGGIETSAQAETADVIFINGTVITMVGAPTEWQQDALAVRGDRVLAVGATDTIEAFSGQQTRIVDLQGRTLMPGIVDPHTHMLNDAPGTLIEAMHFMLRHGYTSVGNAFSNPAFVDEMVALNEMRQVRVRTTVYMIATDNCGVVEGDWYTLYPPSDEPGEMLRTSGVKIFTDGGTCNPVALSYTDGDPFHTQEALNEMVQAAHDRGYQVLLHALGDEAVGQSLNAFEAVLEGEPNTPRHRIDHNAVTRPDQIPRYGEVDPVTVIFAAFSFCDFTPPTPEYGSWEWRWNDLINQNPDLHVAWHGDYPWVSAANPFHSVYSMVTPFEISNNGECPTPEFLNNKQLTVEQALPMMTTEAAYALFREDEVGSLEPDKFADLIVISANPLAIDPLEIRNIDVLATYVGGEAMYCAPELESLCAVAATTAPPAETDAAIQVLRSTETLDTDDNLASGAAATASSVLNDFPTVMATDGVVEGYNWWGSGDFAPGWIEIDLGSLQTIGRLRLVVSQDPPGRATHEISVKQPDGDYQIVTVTNEFTQDLDTLEVVLTEPIPGVRFVRIETVDSPSWVSWREIAVYAE